MKYLNTFEYSLKNMVTIMPERPITLLLKLWAC